MKKRSKKKRKLTIRMKKNGAENKYGVEQKTRKKRIPTRTDQPKNGVSGEKNGLS